MSSTSGLSSTSRATRASMSATGPGRDGDGESTTTSSGTGETGCNASICCDIAGQDCPVAHKCAPVALDGTSYWSGTACVPLHPDPDPVGSTCTVEGDPVSGIDSCELRALCWNVDPRTLEGECVAFCDGSEARPECPEGMACGVFNAGTLRLCLPACDPLVDGCDPGFACRPNRSATHRGTGFVCVPIPVEGGGEVFEGCEGAGCPVGQACASPHVLQSCEDPCCASYCDRFDAMADETCDALEPGHVCVPYFEDGLAPDGLEHVGLCGAPGP